MFVLFCSGSTLTDLVRSLLWSLTVITLYYYYYYYYYFNHDNYYYSQSFAKKPVFPEVTPG